MKVEKYLCKYTHNTQIPIMSTRRAFLRNVILAIPAYSMAGMLLSSCGKEESNTKSKRKKIGILGAGVSGLHAALLLHNHQSYDIEILEASDRIGGRILSQENLFGLCDVENGASHLFGQSHPFYNTLSNSNQLELMTEDGRVYFSEKDGKKSQSEMETDTDYKKLQWGMDYLKAYQSTSVQKYDSYLNSIGIPERVQYIFKAQTEPLLGAGIQQVEVNENSKSKVNLLNDSIYKVKNGKLSETLFYRYKSILPYVNNNVRAVKVEYNSDKVLVTDHLQWVHQYDQLLITLPVSILKLEASHPNAIQFSPALPENKLSALQQLKMDGGFRIHLRLNKKFWEGDKKQIFIDSSIKKYDVQFSNESQYVLSADVMGEEAKNEFYNLSESEIENKIKSNWKKCLGKEIADSIIDVKIKDWGKDSNILGCFSYNGENYNQNTRDNLSKNINNKLYFAGEACHSSKSGTIQGAIETAEMSVSMIEKFLKSL
jgi:monoamine oxidase